MLRAIGAGAAWVALGVYAERALVRKREQLQAWLMAMKTIEIHCTCARETPREMLHAGAAYVKLLDDIAPVQTQQEQKELLEKAGVPSDVRAVIAPALRAVMNGSQAEQAEHVRLAVSQLEMLLGTAREKCERNAKLYMSLGVWGGLCAALMLI